MKTPIQQVIQMLYKLDSDRFSEWVHENQETLLGEEKDHIVDAWVEGNREGWEMNTDWPEHGLCYYESKFKNEQL